jgi:acetylglutamate kinase
MKKVVVKIGGSLAIDEAKLADFVSAISMLPAEGYLIAVVHGGGRDINENIALLSEKPQFIEGLRVTKIGRASCRERVY